MSFAAADEALALAKSDFAHIDDIFDLTLPNSDRAPLVIEPAEVRENRCEDRGRSGECLLV